jgi:multidrug efflux pump subunit AcrA (membrane-fusion protein)
MRGTITSSTKALGDELAASIDTFHNRCSAAEGDISSSSAELSSAVATLTASIAAEQEERRAALTKLQAATETSAAALEASTASKLDEIAAEIDSACARMNAEIAQTAEDVLAIRTVMDAKIEQECETLEASLQRVNRTFSEQLSSFQEDINGQVLVRLDEFDGKLAGMVARLVPCEDKLLEVALRAEVKSQTMLIDMRVAEVSRSAPPLDPRRRTESRPACLAGETPVAVNPSLMCPRPRLLHW